MIQNPKQLVGSLLGKRVLVVGDLMLDEFLRGDVRRISPEAPVPVLDVASRELRLGGAANAAANVRALGGTAIVVGLVGNDDGADQVEAMLAKLGLESHIVRDNSRPTTRKTRIVARGQQIVRVDDEARHAAPKEALAALASSIAYLMLRADACILSDYAKGVVTTEIAQLAIAKAKERKCPIVVDPKHRDFLRYRGATVLTPNHGELETAVDRPLRGEADVLAAATGLLATLDGASILATRGAEGMTLVQPDSAPLHVRALAKTVFDVTGAGDTVVAILALALAAGIAWETTLWMASAAAGIVVSKEGTAIAAPEELAAALAGLA